jgi:hypothetical protein
MTIYLNELYCLSYLFNWGFVLFLMRISFKFCWQHCSHSHTNFVYYNHMGNMAVVGISLLSGSVEAAIGSFAHDVVGSLFSCDVEGFARTKQAHNIHGRQNESVVVESRSSVGRRL